ncbi:signal peptidase II [Sulfuricurvum sp.]|uniref:signal peptidase II n=1 Tax=Sulfuricurvum sp. TaxID=2025608 RepID=UPI0026006058|nr:signal peptidase II [Sulfuricurvum sp.]
MLKSIGILLLVMGSVFFIDQAIKSIFLDGFRLYTSYIDLILVFNKGVAFSMFAFLEGALKWLQLALLAGVIGYTLWLRKSCYLIPVGIMTGAGLSNVVDRFIHGGVVDYVYWHYGFNFAVFNAADVMIDIAVIGLMILNFRPQTCRS